MSELERLRSQLKQQRLYIMAHSFEEEASKPPKPDVV
jgi:hypothetical protein